MSRFGWAYVSSVITGASIPGTDRGVVVNEGGFGASSNKFIYNSTTLTGSLTGSFTITGSGLDVKGRTTVTGNVGIFGDVIISGSLTAYEFNTVLVSASIIYKSGSTKFGDDSADTHQYTGSVFLNDNLTVNGNTNLGNSSSDVATITAQITASNGISASVLNVGDKATTRTNLGLAIGTNVQAYDATLAAVAGASTAADTYIYFTATDTAAVGTITTFGRSLIDDANNTTARTTLGLGTIATQNSNAVTITGGTFSGTTVSASTRIEATAITASAIVPPVTELYDLGSSTLAWRNLFLSGTTTTNTVSALFISGTTTVSGAQGRFGDLTGSAITASSTIQAAGAISGSGGLNITGGPTTLGGGAGQNVTISTGLVVSGPTPTFNNTITASSAIVGITGTIAQFTTVSGSNVTGTIARFTTISGSNITGSSNLLIGGNATVAGILSGSTISGTLSRFTTVDTTNLEVTNLKSLDGISAATIANTTGIISITSLTASSADIDAGTIDNATIGNTTRATGKFTIITTDDDNDEGNIIVGNGTSTVKSVITTRGANSSYRGLKIDDGSNEIWFAGSPNNNTGDFVFRNNNQNYITLVSGSGDLKTISSISSSESVICERLKVDYTAFFSNVNSLTYTSKTADTSVNDASPTGIYFNNYGNKMYIMGDGLNSIDEYTLLRNWDVSTATYTTSSSAITNTTWNGLYISPDGKYVFTMGNAISSNMRRYTLTIPWKIDTLDTATAVSSGLTFSNSPTDLYFKPDGTRVYVTSTSAFDRIFQCDLTTPWDVSTITTLTTVLTASVNALNSPRSIIISPDGRRLFTGVRETSLNPDLIVEYSMEPWDLSTLQKITQYDISAQVSDTSGLFVSPDAKYFYALDFISDDVFQYENTTKEIYINEDLHLGGNFKINGVITGSGLAISQLNSNFGYGLRLFQTASSNHWDIYVNASNDLRFLYNDSTSFGGYLDNAANVNNIDFTGQHRNIANNYENISFEDKVGMIVVSAGSYINSDMTQKPTINESLPTIKLSSQRNEKSVWGVVSNIEDQNQNSREYKIGLFVSVVPKQTNDDNRIIINSIGEGGIWVCNINGNLENGDYITTCEIPGYGMKQDDDLLHNYTVAKITQDCSFELNNSNYDCVEFEFSGSTYRKAFVGCTYHCG